MVSDFLDLSLKPFSIFVLFCCACSLDLYILERSIVPGTYSNHWFGLHRTSSNFLGIWRSWWGGSIVEVRCAQWILLAWPSRLEFFLGSRWSHGFLGSGVEAPETSGESAWEQTWGNIPSNGRKWGMEGSISSFSFIPDCIKPCIRSW